MTPFLRAPIGASLIVLATVHVAPARAGADDSAPSDIVVTAHLQSETARRAVESRPGGANVVEAAAFADKVAVSLRDALAFSPGVYAQPRFGQEVRLSIRGSGISRGFHMRGLTLLQDGIPINLADDNGDFQELDPQVFQRIEVYRGANALRHGGSTLGGAINAVTPTGRAVPPVELRIDGGSFSTFRTKVAAGFANERGDSYLALTSDTSQGDRDHAKRNALRFNGNVGVRLSESIETRLYASFNHIEQDLPGSLTLAQARATPRLSLPANIAGDQERDIDSIRLQSRTTVDLDGTAIAFGGYYNSKKLFHPIFQVIDQKIGDRGLFASVDFAGDFAGLPWAATVGSQARFGTVAARQFVNLAGKPGALVSDSRQTARTINSYGELRLTPFDKLTMIAGAIHISGVRRIENKFAAARSGAAHFDAFAPKFGVLFEPVSAVAFFANYSRSVELPGYSELSQIPVSGLPGFVDVKPQKSWTMEIGTRGRLGIASWDVSLYRADLRDEMLQFAVSPQIPASTFNARKTRHQGIEAGLELLLAHWARVRQVYQFNDFRFRNDAQYGGNRLPVVPKHLYRADLRLGSDVFSLSPGVEWVPTGAFADYRNSTRAPGYVLLGVGAEARLRHGVTLFVDARNLTGKNAVGDLSAVLLATPASVAYYPVERRAVYGGVRAVF